MNPTANPAAAKIAARKLRCGISRAFKVSNTEHPKPASTATLKVATRINRSFFKAFRMGNCCTTQKAGPIPYTADSAAAVESAKKSTYRREECSRATGAATKLNIPIYAACSGMSKRYLVTLTESERAALNQRVAAGRGSARQLTHARILLKAI